MMSSYIHTYFIDFPQGSFSKTIIIKLLVQIAQHFVKSAV